MGTANDAQKKFWETFGQVDWNATSGPSCIQNRPNMPLIQYVRAQTNTSGVYNWTFPVPFDSPPIIEITVEDGADAAWNHRIFNLTNTGVSVQIGKLTSTSLLGVSLLQIASNSQAYVHIMAVQQ